MPIDLWGKAAHGLEALVVTLVFGMLLLAWRDREAVDIGDQLAAVLSVCVGVLFGVLWELTEFLSDWTLRTTFQQSNTDTMTDLLWNDVGAVVAAVLVARVYCHMTSPAQRESLGKAAAWLVDGPSRTLDRHGVLVTFGVAAIGALAVISVWLVGRHTS